VVTTSETRAGWVLAHRRRKKETALVILGIILLVLGLLLGSSLLWILGLILIVVGLIVNLAYARPRGGRYWY
jgi:1,4-dihydroxy-2-naphthoate octaprenyltransferase